LLPEGGEELNKRESILIVDDDETIRSSLALILEKMGYETEIAGTGRKAMERVQASFFNAALLDIRLPDMEGMELLASIKEAHPDMVVIMVTGHASLETAVRAVNEGASAYITKPFSMDEVLATLKTHLERQQLVMENRRLYQAAQRELTERRRAEDALRQSEQKLRSVFDSSPDAITVTDLEGRIVECNQATLELHGFASREEVIGLDAFEFITPTDRQRARENMQETLVQGHVRNVEYTLLTKDGREFSAELSASVILDSSGNPASFVAIAKDITDRKMMEEGLVYAATHDPLTDLPNRMLFSDRLAVALTHAHRRGRGLTVMLMDLDHFKEVNDTLGHSVGDQLLQAVGLRLRGLLRESDTVARVGGDEFALVLPDVSHLEDAAQIAEKIVRSVREPLVVDGHELRVTTSVGIAIYPADGEDPDMMMRNADIAMYEAKGRGRDNHQRYRPAMRVGRLQPLG
jgi:diguanylate cyclase (GGDEF)-like protein/PAS domain S-box-containing protein